MSEFKNGCSQLELRYKPTTRFVYYIKIMVAYQKKRGEGINMRKAQNPMYRDSNILLAIITIYRGNQCKLNVHIFSLLLQLIPCMGLFDWKQMNKAYYIQVQLLYLRHK